MPYVEVTSIIQGAAKNIYPIIKDMEKYPEFMSDLVSVEVLERRENETTTKWVSNVDGKIIRWTEKDVFDDENMYINYEQIEGDLKKFSGDWTLTPVDGGTEVKLTVDFEFGIPMISGLLNPILKRKVKDNSTRMLAAVKERVEKGEID